jgi:hypothetical protein
MGGGGPLGTESSEYTGGGDVSLTTRNGLRGGGWILNRRSSPFTLPLRDGGVRVDFAELLRDSGGCRAGAGCMMGTGAGGGTAILPFGVCR